MRYNRKRHKALKILSKKLDLFNDKKGTFSGKEIGVSNQQLKSILNIDDSVRRLIFSELFENEEVMPYHLDGESGCFINMEKGLEALSNEKYLVRNRQIIKAYLSDFVHIAIPILSLLVAILVIIIDDSKQDKQIDSIELKIEEHEKKLKSLESKSFSLPDKQKDSI